MINRIVISLLIVLVGFGSPTTASAATFFGETCTSEIVHGRRECVGYFTGNTNARSGLTTMFDQPALTDITNKTALINKLKGWLYGSNQRYQVGAAGIIDVMLRVEGTKFTSQAQGIQYAKDHFEEWVAIINYYDSRGLIDWNYNYASTKAFPNSGYSTTVNDMAFITAQTNDTILVMRFRDPNNDPEKAFIIDKWCGNIKGEGIVPPEVAPSPTPTYPPGYPTPTPTKYVTPTPTYPPGYPTPTICPTGVPVKNIRIDCPNCSSTEY